MDLISRTSWITCWLVGMAIASSSTTERSNDNRDTIALIAEANRANRCVLRSFDCSYMFEFTYPEDKGTAIVEGAKPTISKSGRFAFKGAQECCRETFREGPAVAYVRNGTQRKKRTKDADSPGLVITGSTEESGVRPGTPDPWTVVDEGLSTVLDRMPESRGRVVAVEDNVEWSSRKCIKVTVEIPTTLPDGTKESTPLILWYSVNDGYLPIRYELRWKGHGQWPETHGWGEVRTIKKYDADGTAVYVPLDLYEEVRHEGRLTRKKSYRVNDSSVRINTELPDELFQIKIEPEDQVINKDIDLEVQGPSKQGRQLLSDLYADRAVRELERTPTAAPTTPTVPVTTTASIALRTITLCGDVSLDLVYIPAGTFTMGSPDDEIGYAPSVLSRIKSEGRPMRPKGESRSVKNITKGFYMGRYEITCKQFRCFRPNWVFLPYEGRKWDRDDYPVTVSWNEAIEFCKWLSKKTGMTVRLPHEYEWEYACRAGTQGRFYWGDSEQEAGKYGNIADRSYNRSWPGRVEHFNTEDGHDFVAPVGRYLPNKFGLYDMIGNEGEWTQDPYMDDVQSGGDIRTKKSLGYVCRGGNWQSDIMLARCASRSFGGPGEGDGSNGFRVVVENVSAVSSPPVSMRGNVHQNSRKIVWFGIILSIALGLTVIWFLRRKLSSDNRGM